MRNFAATKDCYTDRWQVGDLMIAADAAVGGAGGGGDDGGGAARAAAAWVVVTAVDAATAIPH